MASRFATLAVLLTALGAAPAMAQATDWGVLEGAWVQLPHACPSDPDQPCEGDSLKIAAGVLDWRRGCRNVRLALREQSGHTWRVAVVGPRRCMWFGQRVDTFVFEVDPAAGPGLRFAGYAGEGRSPGQRLFQTSAAFERQ